MTADRQPPWIALAEVKYGPGPHGGLNTALMAQRLKVSRSTVYRWRREGLPKVREDRLFRGWRIQREIREHEAERLRNALEARAGLRLGRGRGVLPSWKAQGWLNEHLVWVRQLKRTRGAFLPVYKVQSARATAQEGVAVEKRLSRLVDEIDEIGGSAARASVVTSTGIVAILRVPTHFDAEIVKYRLLDEMSAYRVRGRRLGWQGARHSLMWLAGGDMPPLASLL